MTTIIADAKRQIIAADSRVTTYSSLTQYAAEKLYRHGKSVFGEAGDVEAGLRFRRWIMDDKPKKGRPTFDKGDDQFLVLELDKDGIVLWDQSLIPQRLTETEFGIGSGHKIALYCMRCHNMTAEEAILEAAKIDIHTAGPVRTLELKPVEK